MNPMDDPNQRDAYLAQRKREAQQMADQMKQERHGSPAPSDRPKAITIGITGPSEGMQALDE